MNLIKKVPIPLSGVMLSVAALGNLLQSYSEILRYFCGLISFLLFILIILKIICYPALIIEDMKNPVMASIAATFPMGIMLLSVYALPVLGGLSLAIWFAAIGLHLILIIYFTYRFILKFDFKTVFASYFIVYVGIAVAGITAGAYNMQAIGTASFWFGFISLLILLPLIGFRYLKHTPIPEPLQPLFCIFTAPASLCLAAYMQSVTDKSVYFIVFMAALSIILYLIALYKLATFIRFDFYPSFAAFTFPFVISAIALKQANSYLSNMGLGLSLINIIVFFQTIIAVLLVGYTLYRYTVFLLGK